MYCNNSEKNYWNSIWEAKQYVHDSFDNIQIEDKYPNGEYCYIFFSSNGICDEVPVEKYIEELVDKNKYEWRSIAKAIRKRKSTGRCIYVRDVYKCYYMHGVSSKYDSIEKTIIRLKEYVSDKNWKIVTVGISSGGYMSVITGMALGAYKIYNISGQYSLKERIPQFYDEFVRINPRYGRIVDMVKEYSCSDDSDQASIYYFCPIGCDHDREQYNMVKDFTCVKTFLFPDKIHASTVYPFNFPDLLTLSVEKMERLFRKYNGKVINKNEFLLRTMTVGGAIEFIGRALKTKFNVSGMKKDWDVK